MVVIATKPHLFKTAFILVLTLYWMPALASGGMSFVSLAKSNSESVSALELTDINSKPIELNNFHGKVTLIHFWATWCVPCLKELPELQNLSEKFRNRGLRVIAVATDSHESVKTFLKNNNTSLKIMVDQYGSAMRDYKVKGLPTSYIIDQNGHMQYTAIGPVNWLSNKSNRLIENLVTSP